MQILLAVSDRKSQLLLKSLLRNLGHDLQLTTNGVGCISRLLDSHPDVLILEQGILWGGSDGVITRMWDEGILTTIPVILLVEHRHRLGIAELLFPEALLPKKLCSRHLPRLENLLNRIDIAYAHRGSLFNNMFFHSQSARHFSTSIESLN